MTVKELKDLLAHYPDDHEAVTMRVADRYGNCPGCEEYDLQTYEVGILNLPGWEGHMPG